MGVNSKNIFVKMSAGGGDDGEMAVCQLSNPLILDLIFGHLNPADIKTVSQVSSSWRSVVEVAKFWSWVRISLSEENFDQIFSSGRFRSIKTISFHRKKKLSETQMASFFFGLEDSALTNLYCNWVRLASVDAETLARVVVRVKTIMMVTSYLTFHQIDVIFKAIVECEDLKLKRLSLCCNDLSQLPPSLLAQAVVRLEEADMF